MTKDTQTDRRIQSREIEKCTQVNAYYTRDYVKGLEEELNKLIKENLYLKSDEYLNKILVEQQNDLVRQENRSMTRKINFLTLLIQQLAYDLDNREDVLNTLKTILDGKFYEVLGISTAK
jgi:hypothetical protein